MMTNQTLSQFLDEELGILPFNISAESQKYPEAIFLKCHCTSLNPLGILKADPERIKAAITEPETWDRITEQWIPRHEIYTASIQSLALVGYRIEYIKMLDNQDDRLMIFCFNNETEHK